MIISRYIVAVGVSWGSKLLTSLMQIILIPLLFKFLGIADFALYNFLIGISAWFSLCELSTNIVLQNNISKSVVKGGEYIKLIGYSFYLYCLLSCVFTLVFVALSPFIYSHFIVKIAAIGLNNYVLISAVFGMFYITNAVFQNTLRVYYALNKAFYINSLNLLAAVIGYGLIFVILKAKLSNSLAILLVSSIMPIVLINIFSYYLLIDRKFNFALTEFMHFIIRIVLDSRHFFWVTLSGAFVLQLDYFFLAYFLTKQDIIQYNWYMRVFGAAFAFFTILIANYYAQCARLIYSNQLKQVVRGIISKIIIGTMIIIAGCLVMFTGRNLFSSYFFNHQIIFSANIILAFGGYFIIRVWTDSWAIPMYNLNQSRYMFKYITIQIILSLILQWLFIKKFGVVGLLAALSLSLLLTMGWLFPYRVLRVVKNNRQIISTDS